MDFTDNVHGARSKLKIMKSVLVLWIVLLWKLTGGKVHATDAMRETSLYNIESLEWDNELLKIFDVPISLMPLLWTQIAILVIFQKI